MKIAMASDHAGFSLKEEIKAYLQSQGHEVLDFGAHSEDACDLPDSVYPASLAVGEGKADRGIFVDGVGYGSAMIANKIYGVYAAVCQDPFCANLARSHSDTNVLCIGGKIIGTDKFFGIYHQRFAECIVSAKHHFKARIIHIAHQYET